jgi:hypothetical protein
MVQSKFSPGLGENDGKMISTWNLGNNVSFITIPRLFWLFAINGLTNGFCFKQILPRLQI